MMRCANYGAERFEAALEELLDAVCAEEREACAAVADDLAETADWDPIAVRWIQACAHRIRIRSRG